MVDENRQQIDVKLFLCFGLCVLQWFSIMGKEEGIIWNEVWRIVPMSGRTNNREFCYEERPAKKDKSHHFKLIYYLKLLEENQLLLWAI